MAMYVIVVGPVFMMRMPELFVIMVVALAVVMRLHSSLVMVGVRMISSMDAVSQSEYLRLAASERNETGAQAREFWRQRTIDSVVAGEAAKAKHQAQVLDKNKVRDAR